MKTVLAITRALADETRLRALMMLADGELCLCQIIDAIGLAPSTVSRHMTILHDAGLVQRRKEGRWHYYRWVADRAATPEARGALRWVRAALADEPALQPDRQTLCCVRAKDLKELTACYDRS